MKKAQKLILALIIAAACAGCGTPTLYPSGSTSALGSDNAAVMFNYGGIYGPVKILRCNPKPGQSVTYGADGAFSVVWVGGTNVVPQSIVVTNK